MPHSDDVYESTEDRESVTLLIVSAKVDDLLRAVAELTARIGHLEVKSEAASAASQTAVNVVLDLRARVDEIAVDARTSAAAAQSAQGSAERASVRAEAAARMAETLSRPMRDRMPTERPSKVPPE